MNLQHWAPPAVRLIAAGAIALASFSVTSAWYVMSTVTPSGGTSGGGGVLVPDYETNAVTGAHIDDGTPDPLGDFELGWLSYNNSDSATATDCCVCTFDYDDQSPGDKLLTVRITAGGGAAVEVGGNAPGTLDEGTYKAEVVLSFSANLGAGYAICGVTGHAKIENNDTAPVEITPTWSFTDPNDASQPVEYPVGGPLYASLTYNVQVQATLEALRPEVDVGAAGALSVQSGYAVIWDMSVSPPVIARKQDTTDAIWVLE